MKKLGDVIFLGTKCEVFKTCYITNGNTAIELTETKSGEPFLSASTNLKMKLKEDEVLIKNYSENEGIKEVLIKNNIIGNTIVEVQDRITLHKVLDYERIK